MGRAESENLSRGTMNSQPLVEHWLHFPSLSIDSYLNYSSLDFYRYQADEFQACEQELQMSSKQNTL